MQPTPSATAQWICASWNCIARQPIGGARQSGRLPGHQPHGANRRFSFPQPGRIRHRAAQIWASRRNGKAGTAALPVALAGQAISTDRGPARSSIPASPASEGHATGHRDSAARRLAPQPGQPQFVRLGFGRGHRQLPAARIAVEHAVLLRGKAEIALDGSLSGRSRRHRRHAQSLASTPTPSSISAFDAARSASDDLLPLIGQELPRHRRRSMRSSRPTGLSMPSTARAGSSWTAAASTASR